MMLRFSTRIVLPMFTKNVLVVNLRYHFCIGINSSRTKQYENRQNERKNPENI